MIESAFLAQDDMDIAGDATGKFIGVAGDLIVWADVQAVSAGDDGGDRVRVLGVLSPKAAAAAALLAVGTVAYRRLESLSWLDAAYCATGVITTVRVWWGAGGGGWGAWVG